jgi:septal ring factor EnvC (AmiA/AmiB activator)
MSRFGKAFAVVVVSALGLWGCAQGPVGASVQERLKALEAKNARLEDDFRSASAARDQLRKQLTAGEAAQNQLKGEIARLQQVEKDRDDLVAQVKARTGERDAVCGQFEEFRRNLRDLIGKSEATAGKPAEAGSAPGVTTSRQS